MTIGLLFAFILSACLGAIGPGIFGILLAASLLLDGGGEMSWPRVVMLASMASLIPLSAYLAAELCSKWASPLGQRNRAVALIAAVGAMYFLLTKVGIEPGIGALSDLPASFDPVQLLSWITIMGGSAIFCAALSAMVISLGGIAIELPLRLAFRAGQLDIRFPYSAVRQCVVVLAAVVLLDLFGTLLSSELAPVSLMHRLVH